jgi:hypothetical protein
MTVELPRWTLADRVTAALAVAAGIVVEAVAAGQDWAPRGAGLAVAAGLLLWHARHRARRPLALLIQPAGSGAAGGRPGCEPCMVHAASRVLGPTVVLHWQPAAGGRRALWLTPLDLPRRTLRRLAVRLATGRAVAP